MMEDGKMNKKVTLYFDADDITEFIIDGNTTDNLIVQMFINNGLIAMKNTESNILLVSDTNKVRTITVKETDEDVYTFIAL